jgi:hypothetical protein
MSSDPLHADMEDRPPPPVAQPEARPAWLRFFGGAVVLIAAITVAVGVWHLTGRPEPALTAEELIEVETLLSELGFPPGLVDGKIDADSDTAIRDFQVTAGLPVNGVPDRALLDELRAADAELN